MEKMTTTNFENLKEKYTSMLTTLRQNIRTSYDELQINCLVNIGQGATSTCPTSSCHLDMVELFNVFKNLNSTSNSSSVKSSSSCANTTIMSTSHTSAARQTTLAVAAGSNEVLVHTSESIDASTFEDAFSRATCQPLIGPTLLDIFVQTGTSQKKCTSSMPMQDYVVKLEIFP